MITETDSLSSVDYGDYYGIIPNFIWDNYLSLSEVEGVSQITDPFTYDSCNNKHFLTVEEIKDKVEHIVKPYLREK